MIIHRRLCTKNSKAAGIDWEKRCGPMTWFNCMYLYSTSTRDQREKSLSAGDKRRYIYG